MNFIFHFIYGIIPTPLNFILFKMGKTTNQIQIEQAATSFANHSGPFPHYHLVRPSVELPFTGGGRVIPLFPSFFLFC
jgi:hypothetical protein